ncbi:hypothetical protein OG542_16650 [Streptomyces violaceus]|uniref:hypothetical protein n=1 Tax=Streptomyces violaceus TaxID=1936 RepID=UPI002E1D1C1B
MGEVEGAAEHQARDHADEGGAQHGDRCELVSDLRGEGALVVASYLTEHTARAHHEQRRADRHQDRRAEQTAVLARSVRGREEALHQPRHCRHEHDVQPVAGDQCPAHADAGAPCQCQRGLEQAGDGQGDQGPREDEGFGAAIFGLDLLEECRGRGEAESFRSRRQQQRQGHRGDSSRRAGGDACDA